MLASRFTRLKPAIILTVFVFAVLFLWLDYAEAAKYIVYFKSGNKRVIGAYRVQGDTVKIFSRNGWVGYPRNSIEKIVKLDDGKSSPPPEKSKSVSTVEDVAEDIVVPDPPMEGERTLNSLVYQDLLDPDSEWVEVADGVLIQRGVYAPGDRVIFKFITQGGIEKKILKITAKFEYNLLPEQEIYKSNPPDWYKRVQVPKDLTDEFLNKGNDEVTTGFKIPESTEPRDINCTFAVETLVAVFMVSDVSYLRGEQEKKWVFHIAYPGEKETIMASLEKQRKEKAMKDKQKVIFKFGGAGLGVVLIILLLLLLLSRMSQKKKRTDQVKNLKSARKSPEEEIRDYIQNNLFVVIGEDEKLADRLKRKGAPDSVKAISQFLADDSVNVQARSSLAKIMGMVGGTEAFNILIHLVKEENPDDDLAVVQLGAVLGIGYTKDPRGIDRLKKLADQEGKLAEFAKRALTFYDN